MAAGNPSHRLAEIAGLREMTGLGPRGLNQAGPRSAPRRSFELS